MPEIGIRGGLKKPPPLRYPLPPAPPASPIRTDAAARAGLRGKRAKKSVRQKLGAMLMALGVMLAVYGWTMSDRDPARGMLMNLGAPTVLAKPVCFCEGHLPKAGECIRAGYLGAKCAQWGFHFSPPLIVPLAGALALAGLGVRMMMRRKNASTSRKTEFGV